MRNEHSTITGIKCKYCVEVFETEKAQKDHEAKLHEKRLLFYSMSSKIEQIDQKLHQLEISKTETLSMLSKLFDKKLTDE